MSLIVAVPSVIARCTVTACSAVLLSVTVKSAVAPSATAGLLTKTLGGINTAVGGVGIGVGVDVGSCAGGVIIGAIGIDTGRSGVGGVLDGCIGSL